MHSQSNQQGFRQAAFVALFVIGLLFAQLATVYHDADHGFHKHTHLCDAFTAYDHSKNLPLAAYVTHFTIATSVVFYAFPVSTPLHAESAVTRIRGPPSLSV